MKSFTYNGVTFECGNKVVSRSTTGHKVVRFETLVLVNNEVVFCNSGCFKNWVKLFKRKSKAAFKLYFNEVKEVLQDKGL